jgi:hypothetical protein
MPHTDQQRQALEQARSAYEEAQQASGRLLIHQAIAASQLEQLHQARHPGDEQLRSAEAVLTQVTAQLAAARTIERDARAATAAALQQWLAPDPTDDISTLSGAYPLVLLPVRLETRFSSDTLKVRIYPDLLLADTHEPALTSAEQDAGATYWDATSAAATPDATLAAWQELLHHYPVPRAAWIVRQTDPANPKQPDAKQGSWTRAAHCEVLPDRWVVLAYREGTEIVRQVSNPVVTPLALTLNPNADQDQATPLASTNLRLDVEVAWAYDFELAKQAGMAVELPLQSATDREQGFDRVVAVGVAASLEVQQAAGKLGGLIDAQHFTEGFAFVPQGSATRSTDNRPSDYPPPDPDGRLSLAVERGDPVGGDGAHFLKALGLSDPQLDRHLVDRHLGGIDRADGAPTERQAATAMNNALWPATLGYYLEQLMAPVFDQQTIASARDYVTNQVLGRGPLPAFRVGSTPYGALPVTALKHWQPLTRRATLLAFRVDTVSGRPWPSPPAICSRGPNRLDVFARAADGQLHWRSLDDSLWTRWEPLGGHWGSDPAVTASTAGRIDLVIRGDDTQLRHAFYPDPATGGWSTWEPIGGQDTVGTPAVCSWGAGRLDVFARRGDNQLVHRFFDNGQWSPAWESLEGVLTSDPAAASWGPGRIDVLVRGADQQLYHRFFPGPVDPTKWSGWDPLPADRPWVWGPAICSSGPNRLEILALDASGQLFQNTWDGTDWTGWVAPRPGWQATAAAVTAWQPEQICVVTRGTDGGFYPFTSDPQHPLALGEAADLEFLGSYRVAHLDFDGVVKGGWSDLIAVPGNFDGRLLGVAVADISGNGQRDLVVATTSSYRIGWNLDSTGVVSGAWTNPIRQPQLAADGGGIALADINRSGRPDLLVFQTAYSGPGWEASYRIGWNLDGTTGMVTGGWSEPIAILGEQRVDSKGGVAVADVDGNGAADLIILDVPGEAGGQTAFRIGWNLDPTGTATAPAEGIPPWTKPIPIDAIGGIIQVNGSLAAHDINDNGDPDLVVLATGAVGGQPALVWRIGRNLVPSVDSGVVVVGGWSGPASVPGAVVQPAQAQPVAIAVTDLGVGGDLRDLLAGGLQALSGAWREAAANVPRATGSQDPGAALLVTLGMDASARQVRVRNLVGPDLLSNLYDYLGGGYFGLRTDADWTAWRQAQHDANAATLRQLGRPAWDPQTGQPMWQPRLAGMVADDQAHRFRGPLVTPGPPAAQQLEAQPLPAERNYIRWLLEPSRRIDEVRAGLPDVAGDQPPLLYLVLRHAMLLEHARVAMDTLVAAGLASGADRRERELVGMNQVDADGASVRYPTIWERLSTRLPNQPDRTLAQHLEALWSSAANQPDNPYHTYRASLAALADLPADELERVFTESLDVCAHRLDAWITSIATSRLEELRTTNPIGSHLGAFGWVEDVRPATGQPRQGGYIHAPSLDHAATAAILRNAYLTRSAADSAQYALNLSSARVREARWLLDSLRQGQPLGAILGYRLERALHERSQASPPQASLERFIPVLRARYPLAIANTDSAGSNHPAEPAAVRTVVDGLALRLAWQQGTVDLDKLTEGAPADAVAALRQALPQELDVLDRSLDTMADLLAAEAVYQLVRGNPTAAAASLDTLAAQQVRPPDPEIARAARGGTSLTHRVAMVLGGGLMPVGWWLAKAQSWPPIATPRAQTEPYLDGWAGVLLGDPEQIRCRVRVQHDTSSTPLEREVTLAELKLRPLDVLALADTAGELTQASELDQRVTASVLGQAGPGATIQISYTAAPEWDRSRIRSFAEVLELARAINAVLGTARPLRPEDLLPPEAVASTEEKAWLGEEALTRAKEGHSKLDSAVANLEAAKAAASAANLPGLQNAMIPLALFGIPDAWPQPPTKPETALDQLRTQAEAVLGEAKRRLAQANRLQAQLPTDASEQHKTEVATNMAKAVFGAGFPFLPRFSPTHREELERALDGGQAMLGPTEATRPTVLRKWLQRAARVQAPLARWRKLALYAETLTGQPLPLEVAQLPYVADEPWGGGPITADNRPPSGRVSLVLHRPVRPNTTDPWAGLLLDEWTELIPHSEELTGISFFYDAPKAQAPQTILIAVPPPGTTSWNLDNIVSALHQTLDLAVMRAVDGDLLGELGQFLPAIHLAANSVDDTIATDFTHLREADQ